jgi:ElaB/YqjD/DUF883 family membrane-anchored ribosome-binding protein
MDPDVLHSWKEIAAYMGRGVRTVQRWERDLALPVRRLAREIDCWLHGAPQRSDLRMSSTRSSGISRLSENRERMKRRSHELVERSSQLLQAARSTVALAEAISGGRSERTRNTIGKAA